MNDALYLFLRGGSGFAIVVAGLALWLHPSRDKAMRDMGFLYLASGFLFCLSALDPVLQTQVDVGNALLAAAFFVICRSLLRLGVALLGGTLHPRRKQIFVRCVAIWAVAMVVLPLLDYALNLPVVVVSVEDGRHLGPLHYLASLGLYAIPVSSLFAVIMLGRWRPRDLLAHARHARGLPIFSLLVLGPLMLALAGLVTNEPGLYRWGHSGMQIIVVASYIWITAQPHWFRKTQEGIRQEHFQRVSFGDGEAGIIEQRLAKLDMTTLARPDLDLARLARQIGLPAYRLSQFFNDALGLSFPTWLRQRRIAWVCAELVRRPLTPILDIALEAGYQSKSTFNRQFLEQTGITPRQYRESAAQSTGER